MCVFVRSASVLRAVRENLSLVISGEAGPAFCHKKLGCLKRQQRARKAVSQIHYLIDTSAPYVGDDRFKSGEISVYVCNEGQAHDV